MKILGKERNSVTSVGTRKSLLQVQKDMLNKILSGSQGAHWKILVFDTYTREIISSQLKMKDLRDHNITLYLNINDHRQQIHGATILYLVQPTLQNTEKIAEDLIADRYTSAQIHFNGEPSANILATLAKRINQSKKTSLISRITKVQFSSLGYFCVDNSMAILPSENQIVNMLVSLSLNPIFVYNQKNSESKELVDKIRTKLQSNQIGLEEKLASPFGMNNNYGVIYMFNRETDKFPALAHGITYASLMESMYRINKYGNKVIYDSKSDKKYDELSMQDEIWLNRKNYLVSELGLDKQLNKINSKMIAKGNDEFSEMSEKESKIKWHVHNVGEMLTEAKTRRIIEFYDVEKQIYFKGLLSKDTLRDAVELLKSGSNAEDKLRLMQIYLLFIENLDELPELESAFPEIKKNGKYNEMKEQRLKGVVEQSATNKYVKKFAKGLWKNLTSDEKKFRVTKELEKVMNSDFSEITEAGFCVEGIESIPKNIRIARNIVYCLGGVCFHEYANVLENDPDCIYSGDQMLSFRDCI